MLTSRMKRTISVGLSKPGNLERDIIYVCLELQDRGIKAIAVSNKDFQYHCFSLAGNLLHPSGKETTNVDGDGRSWMFRPYKEFLEDLVISNEGILDYDRLVTDSILADFKYKKLVETILKPKF